MWKMEHMESKIQGILRIAMVKNGRSFLLQTQDGWQRIVDMIPLCSSYWKNYFVKAEAGSRRFACKNGRTLLFRNNTVGKY